MLLTVSLLYCNSTVVEHCVDEVNWPWDNSKTPCPIWTDTDGTWIGLGILMLGPVMHLQSKEQIPGSWDRSQPLGGYRQPVVKLDHAPPRQWGVDVIMMTQP